MQRARVVGAAAIATALGFGLGGCFMGGHRAEGVDETRMVLDWKILDASGKRTTCAAVGADTVRVLATDTETNERIGLLFPCDAGHGVGVPIPGADYYVLTQLLRCGDDSLCAKPEQLGQSRVLGPVNGSFCGQVELGDVLLAPEHRAPGRSRRARSPPPP